MDLLQTVRKEGSRGGRAEFKWEDVKNDAQRENYLGHSIMAPVGRWQQNRDLNWYAKGDDESKQAEAARLKEEKRKLKEAEEDAMLAAMGLPVPERNNANLTPLGERAQEADVKEAIEEKARGNDDDDKAKRRDKKDRSRRHRDDDDRERRRRHRSRSRSRDRDRRHRHHDRSRSRERRRGGDRERDKRRQRSRSREHARRDNRAEPRRGEEIEDRPHRTRSRSRDRRRRQDSRSRSPYKAERRRD
ncbi:kinase phosphorylation protein-domain-containing protein [Boeremia exigua]|uniref:kinase phosphorylation protein-domain-containing protein n=1 Tax=Boeremia exigua TaxID=749465 RepID=UPI001E8D14BE|nr:kinase phosphorylation protein-domain-containing protein [Boeremia exigua]KAH6642497.1 kinase phosphorylation protein-domain-containing protein [Boeremia exigua]